MRDLLRRVLGWKAGYTAVPVITDELDIPLFTMPAKRRIYRQQPRANIYRVET